MWDVQKFTKYLYHFLRDSKLTQSFLQWFVNLFGALTVLCFFFIIILANYHYSSKDNHKP